MAPVLRSETNGQVPKTAGGRAKRIDVDDAGKALGNRLHDGGRKRRRGSRPRLSADSSRTACRADALLHGDAAFLGELHRRHDEAVRVRNEGAAAPATCPRRLRSCE